MAVLIDKVKWGYNQATNTLNEGLNIANQAIITHKSTIKDTVPIIKLIASMILLVVALSFSKLSLGLTIAFTAVTLIHNLTTFEPLLKASKLFSHLWYTAFGDPAQNHQAVFALGVIAALVAPAVIVPVLAGSMVGDQLTKAVRSV